MKRPKNSPTCVPPVVASIGDESDACRVPLEPQFGPGAADVVGVVGRDGGFVNEGCAEEFDGPTRRGIVGVAGDKERAVERSGEGSEGATGVEGVAVPAMRSGDLEADVAGRLPGVFG